MKRAALEVAVSDTRDHARLRLTNGDAPPFETIVDVPALDAMIAGLGRARAALTADPVPEELERNARTPHEATPVMSCNVWGAIMEDDPDGPEGRIIALRHPGFGWLAFILDAETARQVAQDFAADQHAET